MVQLLQLWSRASKNGPYVRPWGLAAPVLVLVVCLPLLRPLRSVEMSANERARLATVQSIVEYRSLAVNQSVFYPPATEEPPEGFFRGEDGQIYSTQAPTMALLLAGPYWVMHRAGMRFDTNQAVAAYLLTLIGVTLPVALAGALVYRMGRLFELHRPWRALLAFSTVFASGLVSYATVLNSHAPAAALVLGAAAAVYHGALSGRSGHGFAWLTLGGLLAGLASVTDMGAIAFLMLLIGVIFAMNWAAAMKVAGIGWYILGALPPIALHVVLTLQVTGDVRPGFLHTESGLATFARQASGEYFDDGFEEERTSLTGLVARHLIEGLLGPRGLLTHFPVLVFGVGGIGSIVARHWPRPTRVLAAVSMIGAAMIIGAYCLLKADWHQPMFSVRYFIVFMPLLVYWCGAFLRRSHTMAVWIGAGGLLGFSVLASLIGATSPFVSSGHGEYTVYAAIRALILGS